MARWNFYLTFTTSPTTWRCKFGLVFSFAARSRRISSPCEQLSEGPSSNCSKWWKNRLEKRSLWHVDVRRIATRELPLLLNNQYKPAGVKPCPSITNAKPECERTRLQRSSSSGDKVQHLCEGGQLDKALHLLLGMDEQGVIPTVLTYRSLLKACTRRKALAQAKRVHAHLAKHGLESTRFLGESVVNTFVKCGGLEDALHVFYRLPSRTVVSWTAVVSGYTAAGQGLEALRMYNHMREEGLEPNKYTFVSLLKACGSICDLDWGKYIHAQAAKYNLASDLQVATGLIDMYSKCSSIVEARDVFDLLFERDVVSWTAMLSAYVQHGKANKALQLYEQMQLETVSPDSWTFVSALQACGMLAEKEGGNQTKGKPLDMGKAIHAKAWGLGYKSDLFLGNALITMYGKCGSIEDAQDVFDGLQQRDVVSWNALLVAYSQQGLADEALQLYGKMLVEGVTLGARTFVGALQACSMLAIKEGYVLTKGKALQMGRSIHADAWRKGYKSDVFIGNTLISMYGKFGSLVDARKVFDALPQRTLVSWNAMLAAHAQQGEAENAMQLYKEMAEVAVSPDNLTLVSMLQACGMLAEKEDVDQPSSRLNALDMGREVHNIAQRKGYESDMFVANTLISMYGKCGSIVDAQNVFDGLCHQTLVSWNAMLAAYVQQNQPEVVLQLYEELLEEAISPDAITFVSALQAVAMLAEKEEFVAMDRQSVRQKSLEMGRAVHGYACSKRSILDSLLSSSVISMYGKCGSVVDARNTFDGLSQQNLVSWNAMLAAYGHQGEAAQVLQLYQQLLEEGLYPDDRTFVSVFQAVGILAEKEENLLSDGQSSKLGSLEMGKELHAEAVTRGYRSDLFVGSSLVSMYGKCGSISDAQAVFVGVSQQDVVAWNSFLMAYGHQEQSEKMLQLYEQMLGRGVSPDDRTFVMVLQACCILADVEDDVVLDGRPIKVGTVVKGRAIHVASWNKGFKSDMYVSNMLITMYGKCGSCLEAQHVFDQLHHRNVVSWTTLVCAYVQQGQGGRALQLYRQMQEEGVSPNEITHICMLQACSNTGQVDVCKQIHRTLVSTNNALNPLLGNTLIHAYGRCATMVDAQKVFDALAQHNVVSWNTLIAGYAREGNAAASFQCYEQMQVMGMKPDGITFCSLLSACSHAGLVDKGIEYFESMSQDYSITPEIWHYVSMVDLLGRAGLFTRVEHLLFMLPMQPNLALWLCLLGACRKHGKVALGKLAFDCAVHLQPQHAAAYIIMANIYVHAGLWDCAMEVKGLGQRGGASKKKAGQSWIGHGEEVHTFCVGDNKHEQPEEMYHLLRQVSESLQISSAD